MPRVLPVCFLVFAIAPVWLGGCGHTRMPSEFGNAQSYEDRRIIALHYRAEAAMLRKKAQEFVDQAAAYQRLFGEESDWVKGANLLAEFYENAARERARLANHYGRFPEYPSISNSLPPSDTTDPH